MAANAENAYYASNRRDGRGRSDIYHIEPNMKHFKPSLCLLRGKTEKNGKPVKALIIFESLSAKKNYSGAVYSGTTNGDYLLSFPTGAEYQLTYIINDYKPKSVIIDLADMTGFVEKIKNISFDALFDSVRAPVKPGVELPSISHGSVMANVGQAVATAKSPSTAVVSSGSSTGIVAAHSASITARDTLKPAIVHAEKKEIPLTEKQPDIKTKSDTTGRVAANVSNSLSVSPIATKSVGTQPISTNSTSAVKDEIKASSEKTISSLPKQENTAPSVTTVIRSGSWVASDGFEPNTASQEKMMMNAYKYGDITYDSLEFRVQISAFKNNMHYYFPRLEKFGKIDKVELGDGYKRLMLGGTFKTYGRAFAYAKKIIKAGHDDVYIVVIYKGYRYTVEDLEAVGIFK
jgi:hypothetical protein